MPDRPTYRPVYKALHRPLTIWGVDRRLFFLALLLGAATFNLFYSFLAGLLMFGGLYGFALWATARDPEMLRILLASSKARQTLRPGKARPRGHGGGAVVSVGRILRDYRDAGSVNGLLGALGVRRRHDVPDEGRPCRRRLSPSRRRLRRAVASAAPGPRPSLRSRASAPRRALPRLPVPAEAHGRPVRRRAVRRSRSRNEAIQRRAAYLNGRRHDLYDLSLYLVLLYEAPHVVRRSTRASPVLAGARARRSAPGSRPTRRCSSSNRSSIEPSGRCTTRRRRSRSRSATSVPRGCAKARGLPLLPRARELRRRPSSTPPGSRTTRTSTTSSSDSAVDCHRDHLAGRRPRGQGAVDEGAAEPDVRVPAAGPVRDSRRVHRLPRVAAHPERPHAARRPEPPPALLQQARLDRELRLAGDAAGGDAGRRLGERDGPAARRRADGTGGQRPLLRQLLARRSCCTAPTRVRSSTRRPRR